MITINEYLEWYANEKRKMIASGRFMSEPTFLFNRIDTESSYWIFNINNWNGGDILRHGLIDIIDNGKDVAPYEIKYFFYEDQTTIFIFKSSEWYEITWYKNRGRTDMIKKNGNPIYLDEYIELCNELNIPLK